MDERSAMCGTFNAFKCILNCLCIHRYRESYYPHGDMHVHMQLNYLKSSNYVYSLLHTI